MPDEIKRLRARAEEIRTLADGMNHPAGRATMVSIATSYERMADQLENHNQGGSQGGPQSS